MTGGGIVAGKAVVGVARAAVTEELAVKKQLAEMARDSPAMKAAAESYAQRVAIKQAILLKIYQPLAKWAGASRTYFEADGEFAQEMAQKVADIPEEHLGSPRPSVAVPAMQGLGYSLDEPNLKEMYLNLLATATDQRRESDAHPSFAEIIKQLSSQEAALLGTFLRVPDHAVVEAKRHSTGSPDFSYHVELRNLVNVVHRETGGPLEISMTPVWIDNWVRLGLVTISFEHYLSAADAYAWADARPEVERLRAGLAENEDVTFRKGMLSISAFGSRFSSAVGI